MTTKLRPVEQAVRELGTRLADARAWSATFPAACYVNVSIARRPWAVPITHNDQEPHLMITDRAWILEHSTLRAGSATPETQPIKTEVAFFQTVRAALWKTTGCGSSKRAEDLDRPIRQLNDEISATQRKSVVQSRLFLREAGNLAQPLSQPHARNGPDHQSSHRNRPRDARGEITQRATRP